MLNRKTGRFKRPPVKQLTPNPKLKKLALAIVIAIIAALCYVQLAPHTQEAKQRQELEHKTQLLKSLRNDIIQQKVDDRKQQKDKQKKIEELNKQLRDTQKKLEAKRHAATVYAAELPVQAPAPTNGATNGCGDNSLAHFIYMHESGCRTNAVNGIGACGIGQALPCSKMGCGLSDYSCQNAWFTKYMQDRYGSWGVAYTYWMSHGYACGNDVGWCGNW